MRPASSQAAADTLIVAPNWVGDVVMALPTLDALAASGRRLAVLARSHLRPLLELSPAVTSVVERQRPESLTIDALRAGGFRDAVILPNSFRSAWLPWRAGVARRWGYAGDLRRPLLAPAVRRPRGRRHQVEDHRELLAAMGIELGAEPLPRLAPSPESDRLAERSLARARVSASGGPLVALFPGAEFGPSKRWPVARYQELARRLRREVPRLRLAVIAGPKEVWLAVKIHEAVGRVAPVLGADLDLAGLAGLLRRFDLLITNDSGPMHLAAALGTPCVALFGPTDPGRTSPVGDGHAVLYLDRWCSPCFRRRCPLLHHRCLRGIGVEQVAAAVARSLGRAR